jgi:dephospho-CoA kinase
VPPQNGIVLGLIGPVCAGKSEVSRRLRRRGAAIYEADAVVRGLYERPDVQKEVGNLFGASVLHPDGRIDRRAIARRVFGPGGDAEVRRRLTEEIIFPRTGAVLRDAIDRFRAHARLGDVLVVDAPTLLEAGRADCCDRLLLVTAPPERRQEWAMARGWGRDEVAERDAAMIPEAEKRRRADYLIENTGTLDDLDGAADRLWADLRSGPSRPDGEATRAAD